MRMPNRPSTVATWVSIGMSSAQSVGSNLGASGAGRGARIGRPWASTRIASGGGPVGAGFWRTVGGSSKGLAHRTAGSGMGRPGGRALGSLPGGRARRSGRASKAPGVTGRNSASSHSGLSGEGTRRTGGRSLRPDGSGNARWKGAGGAPGPKWGGRYRIAGGPARRPEGSGAGVGAGTGAGRATWRNGNRPLGPRPIIPSPAAARMASR